MSVRIYAVIVAGALFALVVAPLLTAYALGYGPRWYGNGPKVAIGIAVLGAVVLGIAFFPYPKKRKQGDDSLDDRTTPPTSKDRK